MVCLDLTCSVYRCLVAVFKCFTVTSHTYCLNICISRDGWILFVIVEREKFNCIDVLLTFSKTIYRSHFRKSKNIELSLE